MGEGLDPEIYAIVFNALHDLLKSEETSDEVRLKAALTILEYADRAELLRLVAMNDG